MTFVSSSHKAWIGQDPIVNHPSNPSKFRKNLPPAHPCDRKGRLESSKTAATYVRFAFTLSLFGRIFMRSKHSVVSSRESSLTTNGLARGRSKPLCKWKFHVATSIAIPWLQPAWRLAKISRRIRPLPLLHPPQARSSGNSTAMLTRYVMKLGANRLNMQRLSQRRAPAVRFDRLVCRGARDRNVRQLQQGQPRTHDYRGLQLVQG